MGNPVSYINSGSASTSYYTTIGITTVNSNNITAVVSSVKAEKAKKGSGLTRTEIIEVVNEVNSTVNNVSLMMLDEEEQIDINKFDSDNLEKETNMDEMIQDEKDLEEEKQIKKDIVTEDINKTVEVDNDLM